MKKHRFKKMQILIGLLALSILGLGGWIYLTSLNNYISRFTMETIEEISTHDLMLVDQFIENNWQSLNRIALRLDSARPDNDPELEEWLNEDGAASLFAHLYLVADDGEIYTDKFIHYHRDDVAQPGMIDVSSIFPDDANQIAVRYDMVKYDANINKEYVVFGIRLDDLQLAGKNFELLLGSMEIGDIQNRLLIPTFIQQGDNRGYSGVIGRQGYYIVNNDHSVFLNDRDNIYDEIDAASYSQLSAEQLQALIEARESFQFRMIDQNGVETIRYGIPFEDPGVPWYFVTTVEFDIFSEQFQSFTLLSMTISVFSFAALGLMLWAWQSARVSRSQVQSQAQSSYLASMSHEIRNPLNGLIGLIHLLKQEVHSGQSDPKKIEERLDKADETAGYLLSLVNDIMDLNALQEAKVQLLSQPVSVSQAADSVVEMMQERIELKSLDCTLEKKVSYDVVLTDELRLKQILLNILDNAIKFTPEGGRIDLKVIQRVIGDHEVETSFICKDSGRGMSREFVDHIWESFTREDPASPDSGAGLGLAVSRQLADAMNARIQVVSAPGVGSAFTVKLPARISDLSPVYKSGQAEPPAAGSGKILVAEDNELNAEILKEMLEDEGFTVILAANGKEAVEIFKESRPYEISAVLMDMKMPELDGDLAAARIRAMNRPDAAEVLILACTANIFLEDREKAIKAGMNDFIEKPLDIGVLMKILQKKGNGRHE